ncbi:hypothetical protein CH340_01250 [Rhodoplanes serenus]|nr:hypothetical protein CH340_01250 [Rhodoplanes serenus]
MRKSRFSEEQIVGILKEHQAGIAVADLCRKYGISDATFYTWRSRFSGMEVSNAKRLKALEEENRKLKKLLAEAVLDAGRRCARRSEKTSDARSAAKAVGWAMEEKGACGLFGLAPKTFRYVGRREDDAELRERLRALATERQRFGYRRLHLLLVREGVTVTRRRETKTFAKAKRTSGPRRR